jgi:signal transduction histidine kinase
MMSRIENEEYILTEEVDVNKVLKNVVEEIEDKALAKEIDLKLNLSHLKFSFVGNENLLFTLFYNFVNNAIRYTDKGFVEIKALKEKGKFTVQIIDTGIGIKKEKVPEIFSRFKNSNETKDSYGLGLALSKKICDYHKINVEVKSEINKGSCFSLQFSV